MNRRRSFWALNAALVLIAVLSGCARKPGVLSNEEAYKRFVGTWVNTDFPGTPARPQMFVVRPDYVSEDWQLPDSPSPAGRAKIVVKKSWTDGEGYTYQQWFWDYIDAPPDWFGIAVTRVDKAGKVLEQLNLVGRPEDTESYPEEIIPGGNAYFIYYRQK